MNKDIVLQTLFPWVFKEPLPYDFVLSMNQGIAPRSSTQQISIAMNMNTRHHVAWPWSWLWSVVELSFYVRITQYILWWNEVVIVEFVINFNSFHFRVTLFTIWKPTRSTWCHCKFSIQKVWAHQQPFWSWLMKEVSDRVFCLVDV